MQLAYCFSPYFITFLDGARKTFSETVQIDEVVHNFNDLELKTRALFKSLATEYLKGKRVTTSHFNEHFAYPMFGYEGEISRDRIDKVLYKTHASMQTFRDMVATGVLPDHKSSNLMQLVLEQELAEPKLTVEERKERLRLDKKPPSKRTATSETDAELVSEDDQVVTVRRRNNKNQKQSSSNENFLGGMEMDISSSSDELNDQSEEEDCVSQNEQDEKRQRISASKNRRRGDTAGGELVVARKRLGDAGSPMEVETFVSNSYMLDATRQGYMTSITHEGMNLVQALEQRNKHVANVLIEAVFEACCVDDVINDMSHTVVREQNVVAFNHLKRLVSSCKTDEVVTFDFDAFFVKVHKRAFDRLKVVSKSTEEGGTGVLLDWEVLKNSNISRTLKTSVKYVRLKSIFIYAHLNDLVDTLDLKQFRKCGFVTIHKGTIVDIKIPLTAETLLEITGGHQYTAEDMAAFKKSTMSVKVEKSTVKSLKLIKEEVQAKRQERAAEKKAKVEKAKVEGGSPAEAEAALAVQAFLGEEPLRFDVDDDVQMARVESALLASPVQNSTTSTESSAAATTTSSPSPSTTSLFPDSPPAPTLTAASSPSVSSSPTISAISSDNSPTSVSVPSHRPLSPPQMSPPVPQQVQQSSSSSNQRPVSLKVHSHRHVHDVDIDDDTPSVSVATKDRELKAATLLKRLFNESEGTFESYKIRCFCSRSTDKTLLSLVDLVSFVVEHRDSVDLNALLARESCVADVKFQFFRAYGMDEFDTMLAYSNTVGDGYCLFRASDQAELRSENRELDVSELKVLDKKKKSVDLIEHIQMYADAVQFANPHTNLLNRSKLEECLFNAKNFPDELNPRECWGDSSWMRFLKFDVLLLDFMPKAAVTTVEGQVCKWGQVARVPFHYFNDFFYGVPNFTLKQLDDLVRKANYVGYSPGHYFVLENPTVIAQQEGISLATSNWIDRLVPKIKALSHSDLYIIRQYGVTLKAQLLAANTAPSASMITSIGPISLDKSKVPVIQYTDEGSPICCDTLYGVCPNGSYNKYDLDDLLNSV